MLRLSLTLFLVYNIEFCCSFLPNSESAPDFKDSKTHEYITRFGIYGAVAKYLKLKKNVAGTFESDIQCIKAYFSPDNEALQRFESVIDDIVKSNNNVQRDRAGEAKISFNGEQIRQGHKSLVHFRDLIENRAKVVPPNVEQIREIIGQYLYTLQSFYSNTNWIEMRGATVYSDLGIKDAEIFDVASPSENTCKNTLNDRQYRKISGHCPDNIIEVNKLTSGYKSGQNVNKPKSSSYNRGKCSHGGPNDSTRNTTAICGINKETSDPIFSPHNHLHEDAAEAAIKATEHFISGNGTGLINTFKGYVFESVFDLIKGKAVSLAYAIDVSGSMGDDIDTVKSKTIELILKSNNAPADYVLATFNDPEILTTGYITENASVMIATIENLAVEGGGDCPEYALSGLFAAISLSRYGSDVYLFTDASAKDAYRSNEIIQLSNKKNISLSFLLTGKCGRRKKRSKELSTDFKTENEIRLRRESRLGSAFEILAKATGGTVYSIPSSKLSMTLDSILRESFPNKTLNRVCIDFLRKDKNGSNLLNFNVDNGLTKLQIQLIGVQKPSEINLTYPNGDFVDYSSGNNRWESSGKNKVDILISRPPTGQWSLMTNLSSGIGTNISGQGFLDFTFKIMKKSVDGYIYDITGNPIAGETYIVVIKLTGDVEQASLSLIVLIDLSGEEISTYTPAFFSSTTDSRYTANIIMPPMRFFFKIRGNDGKRITFTRIKWLTINPVQVQLTLEPVYDELFINQDHELHYQIRNLGEKTESVLATITDNMGFVVPPMERNHIIASGSTIQDKFICHPTKNPSESIFYSIQLRLSESNETLQTLSKYIYVTSVQHPTCKIVYEDGECLLDEVTPDNCKHFKWLAITETTYSSISLSSVTLSNEDVNTQLLTGNLSAVYGPLETNVSGTCCLDIVDLEIEDTDGYLATCRFNFRVYRKESTNVPVVNNTKNSTIIEEQPENSNNLGIYVGIPVFVLVVCIIIVFLIIRKRVKSSSATVNFPSTLYSVAKPMDKVLSVNVDPSILEQTDGEFKTLAE